MEQKKILLSEVGINTPSGSIPINFENINSVDDIIIQARQVCFNQKTETSVVVDVDDTVETLYRIGFESGELVVVDNSSHYALVERADMLSEENLAKMVSKTPNKEFLYSLNPMCSSYGLWLPGVPESILNKMEKEDKVTVFKDSFAQGSYEYGCYYLSDADEIIDISKCPDVIFTNGEGDSDENWIYDLDTMSYKGLRGAIIPKTLSYFLIESKVYPENYSTHTTVLFPPHTSDSFVEKVSDVLSARKEKNEDNETLIIVKDQELSLSAQEYRTLLKHHTVSLVGSAA